MNEVEKIEYLINYLEYEVNAPVNLSMNPKEYLCSLMNLRRPFPLAKEFIDIQDIYLKEENLKKGLVEANSLLNIHDAFASSQKWSNKIYLWTGDITQLKVEAIVNAANANLLGCFIPLHKCIDNAIHSSAGLQLRQYCDAYMTAQREKNPNYIEPTGSAFISPGYNLPANFIIHTVGPIVRNQLNQKHMDQLKSCYQSILHEALKKGIHTIAFSCISTVEYGFPQKKAAEIAISTIN